jgi:hypothetical protein
MALKVVDNKRLEMTEDEFAMYQKIVKSYTTATNKGEDLFKDLFETDARGVIVLLKPPSKFRTSMEVFLFIMSLQQQQHIRIMYDQVSDIAQQMKDKVKEIDEKLLKLGKGK